MVLDFEENEKEPAKTKTRKITKPCFSVFLAPFGGRMFQINSRTETKQKTFPKKPSLFFGGFLSLPFRFPFCFPSLFHPFFVSLFSLFSFFCFKEKDTESKITPKNTRGKTT